MHAKRATCSLHPSTGVPPSAPRAPVRRRLAIVLRNSSTITNCRACGPGEILCKVRVAGARVCARYSIPVSYNCPWCRPSCLPVVKAIPFSRHAKPYPRPWHSWLMDKSISHMFNERYLVYPACPMSGLSHGWQAIVLPCPEGAPQCRHTLASSYSWQPTLLRLDMIHLAMNRRSNCGTHQPGLSRQGIAP
jgi:hypothetical protein